MVPDTVQFVVRWLKALQSPNYAFNQLPIIMKGFSLEDRPAFIKALVDNETLKVVALQIVPAKVGVRKLCAALREFRPNDRMVFLNNKVPEETLKALPQMTAMKLCQRQVE
ncbi:hypothetical protein MRX96_046908 [Rhipicephalus microplus]